MDAERGCFVDFEAALESSHSFVIKPVVVMGLQIKPRSSTISGGATMTEAEELRLTSPEQLPDLVPLSSESSSRRARSQSVSIPLDQEYIREIGSSLRRFSNEFENRFAERNGQPRRASLTSFLNW